MNIQIQRSLVTLIGSIILLFGAIIYVLTDVSRASNVTLTPTSIDPPITIETLIVSTSTPVIIPNISPTSTFVPPQLSCSPQFPSIPIPSSWRSDYISESFITLEELYTQIYGRKRDFLDIYAIAYYNNFKALEDDSYQFIDPKRLSIEKGWKIFLPPPTWIDAYRQFPSPILEEISQVGANSTITISGSSAISPLLTQISNCFEKETKISEILTTANTTKRGLIDYCQGDADLFVASEEITSEMTAESGCEGVNFVKFEVATYAIIMFINEKNPYANNLIERPLTREELRRLLFLANSWNEVRVDFGDEAIQRYYPATEGGLFEIVKNEFFPNLNSGIPNLSEVEEHLIPGRVTEDVFSVGFSGYAYANLPNNRDDLMIIPIDGISPNLNTLNADNPIYPLTRSLYLFTGEVNFTTNSFLRTFINYYLANEISYIDELGYLLPKKSSFLNNPNTIP